MEIKDPTKSEVNLHKALTELDRAFTKDATCLQVGVQTHLRNWHCSYPQYLAKYLVDEGIVKHNPKGSHKFPLIYYDLMRRPSLGFCREIMDGMRRMKVEGKKVQELLKTNEIVSKETTEKSLSATEMKLELLNDMIKDAKKAKKAAKKALKEANALISWVEKQKV